MQYYSTYLKKSLECKLATTTYSRKGLPRSVLSSFGAYMIVQMGQRTPVGRRAVSCLHEPTLVHVKLCVICLLDSKFPRELRSNVQ